MIDLDRSIGRFDSLLVSAARRPVHGKRALQLVKGFGDGEFAVIIHDPPARALCKTTDMYGAAFYKDLARVLKPGGTLFHYIGNPESR